MKALVTGANGFLGAWLTRELYRQGHEVMALVRKNSDVSELNGVPCQYIFGDVTDSASLVTAFTGVDCVFHLAGVIAYKKSERPLMDKVNVQGTQNVVDAIIACKVPKLVYLSSVVAIGASFEPKSLNEESSYNIRHLNLGYFETKHEAEIIVKKACDQKLIEAVILNPSTIYGAGDSKKGSRKTQLKVAQGKFPFYTSGGVNVVAVEDVVQAIINAASMGKNGERYILSGENMTIKELFQTIAHIAQQPPPKYKMPDLLLHGIGLIGDLMTALGLKAGLSRENAYTATMYHWFDSSKAQRDLQFKPRPAKEAIRSSVEWSRSQGLL